MHEALEVLGTALTLARERQLLVNEGGVLGVMAAARLGLGDRGQALALAQEAIEVCRRRGRGREGAGNSCRIASWMIVSRDAAGECRWQKPWRV
jgi:hypothetical protein